MGHSSFISGKGTKKGTFLDARSSALSIIGSSEIQQLFVIRACLPLTSVVFQATTVKRLLGWETRFSKVFLAAASKSPVKVYHPFRN